MSIRGMVRNPDHDTSTDAATSLLDNLSDMERQVFEAFKREGPMNDEELGMQPEFSLWAESTARKRRTELFQANVVVQVGTKKNSRGRSMKVWDINPSLTTVAP